MEKIMTAKQHQRKYVKQQLSRLFNLSSDPKQRLSIENAWIKFGFSGQVGGRNRKTIQTTEEL